MDNVASAKINSFGNSPKADFVSPSRDQLITLTIGQLQDLLTEAIQPLQDEVESFRATVARQDEKIAALESTQEQDLNRVCLDIAYDRQRIARLEKSQPGPLQKDRGDILRALIVANGGRILAKDARQKMRISKQAFSNLLAVIDDIEARPLNTDMRQKLLVLR